MLKYLPLYVLTLVFATIIAVSATQIPVFQLRTENSAIGSSSVTASGNDVGKSDSSHQIPGWKRFFTWPDGDACIAVIATLLVIAWQSIETRASARATEDSVRASQDTAKRQLRAYIIVSVGQASYQERDKGIAFGALPQLRNTGQTPAHSVHMVVKAKVFQLPLRRDESLSEVGDELGETVVGIDQAMTMHGRSEDFVHDDDVESIKMGDRDKALFTWGIIHYTDIYGESHYTRFCHQLKWLHNGDVYGYYVPGRNEAT